MSAEEGGDNSRGRRGRGRGGRSQEGRSSGSGGKGRNSGRGRSGQGRSGGRSGQGGGRNGNQSGQSKHAKATARPIYTEGPRKGKAHATPYEVPQSGAISPFDLFCCCFVGLMPDGSYRGGGNPNLNEVGKRLRRSGNELRSMLQAYAMDAESIKGADFDVAMARLDIQVAPEGMDRRELARGLFDELVEYHPPLEAVMARLEAGETVYEASPEDLAPVAEKAPAQEDEGRAEAGQGKNGRARRSRKPRSHREATTSDNEESTQKAPVDAAQVETALVDTPPTADVAPVDVPEATEPVEAAPVAVGGADSTSADEKEPPVRRVRRSPVRRGKSD